jgi:hypothetical protein
MEVHVGRLRTDMLRRGAVLCLAAAVAAACGAAEPDASGAVVRDSAGIRIVENTCPTTAARLRLSPDPVLSIGAAEGTDGYLFHGILGARRLSDGRFVVANRGTSELRFFDADGGFLRAVGGEGDGPGEYRFMSLFWTHAGDTLVVSDARGLTVLDPEGTYVRLIRPLAGPGGSPVQAVGQLRDGSLLATGGTGTGARPVVGTVVRDSTRFHAFDADGTHRAALATFPRSETMFVAAGAGVMPRRVPFAAHPAWAAAGDRFYLTSGREPRLEVWRADGVLESVIRWSMPGRELTGDHIARYREHLLASTSNPDTRRQYERFLNEAPLPDRIPATGELFAIIVAANGDVWVESYRPPWQAEAEWLVFSSDGEWRGSVQTPPGLTLHQVGHEFVVGSWRDELGVEYVHVYGLTNG